MAVAVPLAAGVLVVARGWWRRGDRALAACLGALAMLLASPVSWSHHWVWAVPMALALWQRSRVAALLWTAVFVARPMLWLPWAEGREHDWRWWEHLPGQRLRPRRARGRGVAGRQAAVGSSFIAWSAIFFIM